MLRRALGALWHSWPYSVTMIVSLATAIGANSAIYLLVDALLLRPLPYEAPHDLVTVQDTRRTADAHFLTPAEVDEYSRTARTMTGVAAYRAGMGRRLSVRMTSLEARVDGVAVSGNTFSLLGRRAHLGRTLLEADDSTEAAVVLLSYATWARQFASNPSALGTTVLVEGRAHEVIGVMPRGFWYPFEETAFWIPLGRGATSGPDARTLSVVGRLSVGAGVPQVMSEVAVIGAELDRRAGTAAARRVWRVATLDDAHAASDASVFFVLQGLMLVVLTLACLNASNLSIARSIARRKETAIRLALGAPLRRALETIVAELLLLVLVSAVLGGALALVLVQTLVLPAGNTAAFDLVFDGDAVGRALLSAGALGAGCALVCGITPVVHVLRTPILEVLKEAHGTATRAVSRLRRIIVSVQVGGSAALLVIAAGLAQGYASSARWTPSFPVAGLFTFEVRPAAGGTAAGTSFTQFESAIRSAGEAQAVAAAARFSPRSLAVRNATGDPSDLLCFCFAVTSGFFEVARYPLRGGRLLAPADAPGTVAVVDEAFAERLGGIAQALESTLQMVRGEARYLVRIVGVVGSAAITKPGADAPSTPPALYAPALDTDLASYTVSFRAPTDAPTLARIRATIVGTDPAVAAYEVLPVSHVIAERRAPIRWYTLIVGMLGLLATTLAASGLAGLMLYIAQSRRPEMSLRIALGASEAQVRGLMLRLGMRLSLVGIVVGSLLGAAALRAASGIVPVDGPALWLSFAAVGMLMIAITLGASWWPARIASKADPRGVIATM